jgi:uncharacterized protein YjiS (DUF1127 family)
MIGSSAVAEPRHTSAFAGAIRAAGATMLDVAGRIAAAHSRARTLRILSGLDDDALKDIGINRGSIDAVERDPRYRHRFPGF